MRITKCRCRIQKHVYEAKGQTKALNNRVSLKEGGRGGAWENSRFGAAEFQGINLVRASVRRLQIEPSLMYPSIYLYVCMQHVCLRSTFG